MRFRTAAPVLRKLNQRLLLHRIYMGTLKFYPQQKFQGKSLLDVGAATTTTGVVDASIIGQDVKK